MQTNTHSHSRRWFHSLKRLKAKLVRTGFPRGVPDKLLTHSLSQCGLCVCVCGGGESAVGLGLLCFTGPLHMTPDPGRHPEVKRRGSGLTQLEQKHREAGQCTYMHVGVCADPVPRPFWTSPPCPPCSHANETTGVSVKRWSLKTFNKLIFFPHFYQTWMMKKLFKCDPSRSSIWMLL